MSSNFNTEIYDAVGRYVEPSLGFKKAVKPSVTVAKFGDGYSQRTVAGLNNMPAIFQLTYQNQPLDVITAIENFLIARKGTEPFFFTPPGESQLKVIATDGWDKEYTSEISRTLTVTFVQVFDPL